MKKFLKILVIFLGLLIIILFSITIFVILSKYKNNDDNVQHTLKLIPQVEKKYEILSFQIEKNFLYIYLFNPLTKESKINTYNIENGNLIRELYLN
ncbi:MAG: hypothetical protein CMN01_04105 [Rickettsiales bacterium]|nr:hypothetical protein [Rickettsiales bacterium]|tara:strand:- start:9550 stop:9837 length:288 start_codon:yes stop_codon:yes gene_type:complete